jgi:hypothetical protein
MNNLTSLETAATEALLKVNSEQGGVLASEDAALLLEQLKVAKAKKRSVDGAGFFTDFAIPEDAPRLVEKKFIRLDGVSADIEDTKDGAGFLLVVEDGALKELEGYTQQLMNWSPYEGERFKLRRVIWTQVDPNTKQGTSVDL